MPSCHNLSPAASDDHVSDTSNNPNDIINNIGLHVQYSIKKLLHTAQYMKLGYIKIMNIKAS